MMNAIEAHRRALSVFFTVALAAYSVETAGHAQVGDSRDPRETEREDSVNRINGMRLEEGKVVEAWSEELPPSAFSNAPRGAPMKKTAAGEERPPDKLHPELKTWLATAGAQDLELVVVTFREDLKIPPFPRPDLREPRESEYNQRTLARTDALIARITQQRAPRYEAIRRSIRALSRLSPPEVRAREEVLSSAWLIPSVTARLSSGVIQRLAKREDVLYVEPERDGSPPPQQDTNPNNDVDDGRARIMSDPYFNLGQTGGFMGLLDTGLRFTHSLLANPSTIAFRFDCAPVPPFLEQCITNAGDPTDDCWNHGTASAAILTGNGNLGGPFRGVTAITVDSFKVYPRRCGGLSTSATRSAFERAVAVGDRIIVAETQGTGNDLSAISLAADAAFDRGAMVIAANGNFGPNAGTVRTPANAHKVIGVGAIDVQTGAQYANQSRGPAPDGRIKPDIQAPTRSETASTLSDVALKIHGGTSGATPYAAGAAALLRNWMSGGTGNIDPGQVYAALILSGQQPAPFGNTRGAGPINMPLNGLVWFGKVNVTGNQVVDIPLPVHTTTTGRVDVALWWPTHHDRPHWDIDLLLWDQFNSIKAFSTSVPSVFERARFLGAMTQGNWRLQIRAINVTNAIPNVYWIAHVREQ